mgnify:CR=1 FL=1
MRTRRVYGLALAALLTLAAPVGQLTGAGARMPAVDAAKVSKSIVEQKDSRTDLQTRLRAIPTMGAVKPGEKPDMNQAAVAVPQNTDSPKVAEQSNRGVAYVAEYSEPNDQAHRNYCGPGAATVVISHFDAAYPSKGDIDKLGSDMNMDPSSGVWVKDIVKPVNDRINAAVGQELNWYKYGEASTIDEFRFMLQYDIIENGVPLITSLQTAGLPGWGGQDVGHIVAVHGYGVDSEGKEFVTYTDTAPAAAGYNAEAFHTVDMQTFWNAVSGNSAQVW